MGVFEQYGLGVTDSGGGTESPPESAPGAPPPSGGAPRKGWPGYDGRWDWEEGKPVPGHPGWHYNAYGGGEPDSTPGQGGAPGAPAGTSATAGADAARSALLGDYAKYHQGSPLPRGEYEAFLRYFIQKEGLNPRPDSLDRIVDAFKAVGVNAKRADHGGKPSDDKLDFGDGSGIDLISGVDGPNPGWWYGWYGAGQGGGGTGTESTDPNSPYFHDFTAQGPS